MGCWFDPRNKLWQVLLVIAWGLVQVAVDEIKGIGRRLVRKLRR